MIRVCPDCGKEKEFHNGRQVYCDECRIKRRNASQVKAYKKLYSEVRYMKDWQLRKLAKKHRSEPKISIDEVLIIRDMHKRQTGEYLSYGQTVQKFNL